MKILARHKWFPNVLITESVDSSGYIRRFTATIKGWRGWKIYEGTVSDRPNIANEVKRVVQEILDLIEAGDEEVFRKKGYFLK